MFWTNRSDADAYFVEREAAVRRVDALSNAAYQRRVAEALVVASTKQSENICLAGSKTQIVYADDSGMVVIPNTCFGSEISYIVALINEQAVAVCNAQQNEVNKKAISYFNDQRVRSLAIKAHCDTFNQTTNDMTYYQYLVDEFNANVVDPVNYYACEPTVSQLQVAYNAYWDALDAGYVSARNAFATAYANANRELSNLSAALGRVQTARQNFDQSVAGNDLSKISLAHAEFIKQRDIVAAFKLVSEGQYDASKIFGEVNRLVNEESKHSAVSELDNLRQEYFTKGIPVPIPTEFTQSKSSVKFDFSQLKTGAYSWAILRDTLLNNLDSIVGDMETAGYKVQVNSVYRNPMHPSSSGASQHQYGTAVDIQVFDFDGSKGPINEKDWELLMAIAKKYNPVYPEPVAKSGVGHVHVDWRGMSIFLETFVPDVGCDHGRIDEGGLVF